MKQQCHQKNSKTHLDGFKRLQRLPFLPIASSISHHSPSMAPALVKYVAVPINGWTTKSQSSSRSSSCQMRSDWHFFGASQAMLLRSACCSLVRNDSPVLTPRWPSRYYEQLDLSSQKNPSKEWQGSSKPKNPVGFISLSVILFLDIRHNQVWNTLKWSDSTWQYNRVHLSNPFLHLYWFPWKTCWV